MRSQPRGESLQRALSALLRRKGERMGAKPRKPRAKIATEKEFHWTAQKRTEIKPLFVSMDIHHWGVGHSMLDAEQKMKACGGRVGTRGKDSHCVLVPAGAVSAWVDAIGRVWWKFPEDSTPDVFAREVEIY